MCSKLRCMKKVARKTKNEVSCRQKSTGLKKLDGHVWQLLHKKAKI